MVQPFFPSIAILSPCPPATHHTNHSAAHTTSCIVHSSQSPSSLPVGQALERSPKAYLEARPQGLLHRPLRPQQRRPLPLPLPQSTPDHHSRCRHNQSLLNSPPAPSHRRPDPTIPACRPSPAADSAHFAPLRRSQASHRADSGSLCLLQQPFPFVHRPPSTAHRPSSGATLQPLPQPPTTATSTTPITPTTTTTPAKTCLQSTPHPHNGGENGALQAGGAG